MKLLTKKIKDKLISNHQKQDGTKTFRAELKLFNPTGMGTWYISELNPETNVAFGLCDLHETEFGYISLDELEAIKLPFGLSIERDKFFQPKEFQDIIFNINKPDNIQAR
jgi:hypothetical protein